MAKKMTVKRTSNPQMKAKMTSMPQMTADAQAQSGFIGANMRPSSLPQMTANMMENPSLSAQTDMMEERANANRRKVSAVVTPTKKVMTPAARKKVKVKARGTFKNSDGQDVVGDYRAFRGE